LTDGTLIKTIGQDPNVASGGSYHNPATVFQQTEVVYDSLNPSGAQRDHPMSFTIFDLKDKNSIVAHSDLASKARVVNGLFSNLQEVAPVNLPKYVLNDRVKDHFKSAQIIADIGPKNKRAYRATSQYLAASKETIAFTTTSTSTAGVKFGLNQFTNHLGVQEYTVKDPSTGEDVVIKRLTDYSHADTFSPLWRYLVVAQQEITVNGHSETINFFVREATFLPSLEIKAVQNAQDQMKGVMNDLTMVFKVTDGSNLDLARKIAGGDLFTRTRGESLTSFGNDFFGKKEIDTVFTNKKTIKTGIPKMKFTYLTPEEFKDYGITTSLRNMLKNSANHPEFVYSFIAALKAFPTENEKDFLTTIYDTSITRVHILPDYSEVIRLNPQLRLTKETVEAIYRYTLIIINTADYRLSVVDKDAAIAQAGLLKKNLLHIVDHPEEYYTTHLLRKGSAPAKELHYQTTLMDAEGKPHTDLYFQMANETPSPVAQAVIDQYSTVMKLLQKDPKIQAFFDNVAFPCFGGVSKSSDWQLSWNGKYGGSSNAFPEQLEKSWSRLLYCSADGETAKIRAAAYIQHHLDEKAQRTLTIFTDNLGHHAKELPSGSLEETRE
jgi:hypothetical protein